MLVNLHNHIIKVFITSKCPPNSAKPHWCEINSNVSPTANILYSHDQPTSPLNPILICKSLLTDHGCFCHL